MSVNAYGKPLAANNSLSSPEFILKLSMGLFLAVQAIRQLMFVNNQFNNKKETRAGQVASWMTITMTLIIAALLYPSTLSTKTTMGGLALLVIGAMGSGIGMIYASLKKDSDVKDIAESSVTRLWFGIAHVVFAMVILAFLLYSLSK